MPYTTGWWPELQGGFASDLKENSRKRRLRRKSNKNADHDAGVMALFGNEGGNDEVRRQHRLGIGRYTIAHK